MAKACKESYGFLPWCAAVNCPLSSTQPHSGADDPKFKHRCFVSYPFAHLCCLPPCVPS